MGTRLISVGSTAPSLSLVKTDSGTLKTCVLHVVVPHANRVPSTDHAVHITAPTGGSGSICWIPAVAASAARSCAARAAVAAAAASTRCSSRVSATATEGVPAGAAVTPVVPAIPAPPPPPSNSPSTAYSLSTVGGDVALSANASHTRRVWSQDAESKTLALRGQNRTSETMFWCPCSTAAGIPDSRNHVRTV